MPPIFLAAPLPARRGPLSPGRAAFRRAPTPAGPGAQWLDFFGNSDAAALFDKAIERLEGLGGRKVEIDYTPFTEINDLLFKGPWLAERYGALQRIVDEQPGALFPITRDILVGGRNISGAEVYAAQQRLNILKRQVAKLWNEIDIFVVPTTGTIYRIDELQAD